MVVLMFGGLGRGFQGRAPRPDGPCTASATIIRIALPATNGSTVSVTSTLSSGLLTGRGEQRYRVLNWNIVAYLSVNWPLRFE